MERAFVIAAISLSVLVIIQEQGVYARQFRVNWQSNATYPTERLFNAVKQLFDANILCGNSRDDVINNIDRNIAVLSLNKDYLKSQSYIDKLNSSR
ncbi:MAG: hypothetical protein WBP64_13085 [Nitrososphaeraceae archaeon]